MSLQIPSAAPMMGTAPGFLPGILDRELLDEIVLVSEEEAFAACREIDPADPGLLLDGLVKWLGQVLA